MTNGKGRKYKLPTAAKPAVRGGEATLPFLQDTKKNLLRLEDIKEKVGYG